MNITGNKLAEVPQSIVDTLQINELFYRNYRHWVGKSAKYFYKLAPKGSVGQKHLEKEGNILKRLNHPNIVTGDFIEESDWEILRIDAISGEPLRNLRKQLSINEKQKILKDIENAIMYVNSQGILHADINFENVIWDRDKAYLIDFEEAKQIIPPLDIENSPDVIGGPPCCWGDIGYGYKTYQCLNALREWLLYPEFLDLKEEINRIGIWNPNSIGNTCDPDSTPDNGSVYQNITFGNETLIGQRNPEQRFYPLLTSKKISFDNKTVLDIGCNFGRLGSFLEKFNIERYVGIDINSDYIDLAEKIARLENRKKSTFVTGEICNYKMANILTDLSPNGYDIVLCQSVYHHFVDKRMFWKIFSTLRCHWFIFEGSVNNSKYLIKESWSEEKAMIEEKGYETTFVSYDNDFRGRVLVLFEKVHK